MPAERASFTGIGLTPDELAQIKARWGLDGGQPQAYVDFAHAQADIKVLVEQVEREWSMPWKMRGGTPKMAVTPPAPPS